LIYYGTNKLSNISFANFKFIHVWVRFASLCAALIIHVIEKIRTFAVLNSFAILLGLCYFFTSLCLDFSHATVLN
jgi:hypothetical protein